MSYKKRIISVLIVTGLFIVSAITIIGLILIIWGSVVDNSNGLIIGISFSIFGFGSLFTTGSYYLFNYWIVKSKLRQQQKKLIEQNLSEQQLLQDRVLLVDETKNVVPEWATNAYLWKNLDYKFYDWNEKQTIIYKYLVVSRNELPVCLKEFALTYQSDTKAYSHHFKYIASKLDYAINLRAINGFEFLQSSQIQPLFMRLLDNELLLKAIDGNVDYKHQSAGLQTSLLKNLAALVIKNKPSEVRISKIQTKFKWKMPEINPKILKRPGQPLTYRVQNELNKHNI